MVNAMSESEQESSFYDQFGGAAAFEKLVDVFYEGVWSDESLRVMYPQDDFEGAKNRLRMFLVQYWGGPADYSAQRGHPRLRMRHQPYPITPHARDRWLFHMRNAMDSLELSAMQEAMLWDHFERAAHSLVNTFDQGGIGASPQGREQASLNLVQRNETDN